MLGCLERSPWIVHYNCNSCNGCDIEVLACLTPMYDVERFGVVHVGNPKHADILVVTGSVNHRNAPVLRHVYEQMPEPRLVVALGACGATGGIFATGYNVLGGIDKVIPVDVWVPGCPPRPEAIIDGILQAVTIWKQRGASFANGEAPKWKVTRIPNPTLAGPPGLRHPGAGGPLPASCGSAPPKPAASAPSIPVASVVAAPDVASPVSMSSAPAPVSPVPAPESQTPVAASSVPSSEPSQEVPLK